MIVEMRAASAKDVRAAIPFLRSHSMEEAKALGIDTEKAVEDAVRRANRCWIGTVDSQVVCLWGIETKTLLSNEAYLWLITTDLVEKYQFAFLRRNQQFIKELSKEYKTLWGTVAGDFEVSLRWLRWLGFEIERPRDDRRYLTFKKVS